MAGIVANGVPLAQRPSQERGFTAREMAQTDGVHDPGVWIGIAAQQYSDHKSLERIPVMGKWIRSEQRQFASGHEPIRTPLLIWGGMPEDLLTLILQRTILGLESYVSAAVWMKLGELGRLTPELNRVARNPFEIRPRQKGTANCYYNALPALIDPKYALKERNAILWRQVEEFYKAV